MFVFAEASNVASADGINIDAAAMMARGLKLDILFEIRISKKLYKEGMENKNSLESVDIRKCQRKDANKCLLAMSDRHCRKSKAARR